MTQAVQYIEIDIDHCALTYGVAPCTASLTSSPPTGTRKCFNTLATCQDRPNFSEELLTLRFAVPTAYLPASIEAIPSIKSITFDPATISLGQDLGQRATITVTFEDHKHSDTGLDKYLADRSYDPFELGTFFGKFRARVPFLRGRNLRWINGAVGQTLAQMETRYYIIDSYSGPTNSGEYVIIAKDVLKLADGDRALAPITNTGFLQADITNVATSATLAPTGVGNLEYAASGYVAIGGNEIASFTRAGDALTLTRGQFNTVAAAHSAQDRVQTVLRYSTGGSPDSGLDPAVIIADLLQTYAGVPSAYIPLATWQLETSTYLNRLFTATIGQPTSVATLISELIEQAGLTLWWNDRTQQIGLLVLRGAVPENQEFTSDNVMKDSLDIAEQPDKRLSQVHTYFGQINPLTSLTEKSNYRSVAIVTDEQLESDYGSAAIKEIFSRWIPANGRTIADRINAIILGRFKNAPRHFKIKTLRNTTLELLLARVYNLTGWPLQDDTGAAATAPIQLTRLKPMADIIEVEGEEMLFEVPPDSLANRTIIIDTNTLDFNAKTTHDLLYPAASSGDSVTIIINAGVIVGASSPAARAFDVGTWPAGVDVIVQVLGTIEGAGGPGAPGTPTSGTNAGQPGSPGGTALYTRKAITLIYTAGAIWAGGGGGGAGGRDGHGGGGGAGFIPGAGGITGLGQPNGADGTQTAGGAGGTGVGNAGGNGGGPGLDGAAGIANPSNPGIFPGGAGGSKGTAIDGVSFVTVSGAAGDLRGPTIN